MIMRHELKMRFKKVVPISVAANSVSKFILRQQFAKVFLDLDFNKKTIINVDEIWLGMSDFTRRKWRFSGTSNSVPKA